MQNVFYWNWKTYVFVILGAPIGKISVRKLVKISVLRWNLIIFTKTNENAGQNLCRTTKLTCKTVFELLINFELETKNEKMKVYRLLRFGRLVRCRHRVDRPSEKYFPLLEWISIQYRVFYQLFFQNRFLL